ncbi:hypothetical protein BC938DRAFT_473967 [Jimgerdemannia flammicorona]|uniref:F-box domain-containing protein n=1 Tax=Jimgerdemannia flammicorona TaxID=994334 RepID=A0A433Q300_9FUNG|nr:hypothetical protein BC938DRAFT_473967 [Jimgerdemannia flammicorona]
MPPSRPKKFLDGVKRILRLGSPKPHESCPTPQPTPAPQLTIIPQPTPMPQLTPAPSLSPTPKMPMLPYDILVNLFSRVRDLCETDLEDYFQLMTFCLVCRTWHDGAWSMLRKNPRATMLDFSNYTEAELEHLTRIFRESKRCAMGLETLVYSVRLELRMFVLIGEANASTDSAETDKLNQPRMDAFFCLLDIVKPIVGFLSRRTKIQLSPSNARLSTPAESPLLSDAPPSKPAKPLSTDPHPFVSFVSLFNLSLNHISLTESDLNRDLSLVLRDCSIRYASFRHTRFRLHPTRFTRTITSWPDLSYFQVAVIHPVYPIPLGPTVSLLARKPPPLQVLKLDDRAYEDTTPGLASLLQSAAPNLNEIFFPHFARDTEADEYLALLASLSFPCLATLDISQWIENVTGEELLEFQDRRGGRPLAWPLMETLRMGRCSRMNPKAVRVIIESCPKLRMVEVSSTLMRNMPEVMEALREGGFTMREYSQHGGNVPVSWYRQVKDR